MRQDLRSGRMVLGVYTNGPSTAAMAQVLSMMPWSQSMHQTRAQFSNPVLHSTQLSDHLCCRLADGQRAGRKRRGHGVWRRCYRRRDRLPNIHPHRYLIASSPALALRYVVLVYVYIHTHVYTGYVCIYMYIQPLRVLALRKVVVYVTRQCAQVEQRQRLEPMAIRGRQGRPRWRQMRP